MASAAEIQAQIDAIDVKLAATAGIRGTSFGDQAVTFDYDSLVKERARLTQQLALASGSRSTTRYAATSKGV